MYDYLIYSQLKKYARAEKSFHVPGHKARGDFKAKFPIAQMDVTELSYSDNLFCPSGIIDGAQKDIAEILGAKKSYILTGGSSAGVLSMLSVAAKRGNKLIVPRNSHQSVWNACKIFGIEPVIVQGASKHGVVTPPAPELIERLIENDVNISGMVVTHPDYYGNFAPLKKYSDILKKHKRLLFVDGAHGAHLAFEPESKGYSGVYADIWVDGAHKSLPVLTQGAVISVNNLKLSESLDEALSIFRTTSPSYPVMASVEYGIKYLSNNKELIENAKRAVDVFKEKSELKFYPSDDWTKLAIDFKPLDISPDEVAKRLEKRGIYAELSDGRYLLFYVSPMVGALDLNKLGFALTMILRNKKLKGTFTEPPQIPENERTYSFQYALKNQRELIPLKRAAGRMCAVNAGVTPPCIPVVVAGELITDAAIKTLSAAKNTFGIKDGNVWVVKK